MTKPLIAILIGMLSVSAFAADQTTSDSQSTLKVEDLKDKNKVSGDLDEEISNAKLRAESGSKSKWSGSFTAIYQGASLEKPLDKDRPNPTNQPIPDRVKMFGDIGIRYRMDKNQSLAFGTGYSIQRPLQEAKTGEIDDPYIQYNNTQKVGTVQSVSSLTASAATNLDERTAGEVAAGSVMQTFMYDFNGSRASIGLAFEGDYNYYNVNPDTVVTLKGHSPRPAAAYQTDYALAAYPMFEYAFSDRFQFRTVFRPWNYVHTPGDGGWTFAKYPWTQSIGLGIAVTRDVYLYPNFQYAWEDWRGDDFNWFRKNTRANSTVGLNATINVF